MEIREFAERLLCSPELEDKLYVCDSFEDKDHRPFKQKFIEPCRSDNLQLAKKGRVFQFAEFKALKNDEQIGRCLHFFANHELQAIELMAMALLKFPEAPMGLRRQLVSAIQDEQKHTKLYLKRMEQCGIELGAEPLNRFFWDSLHGMSSIESFLAGMSLTLEQANLDFANEYIKRFQKVGDIGTSAILKVVLEDELKHVRLGVEYFKKYHSQDHEQIWEVYKDHLEPPLFPTRAKAHPFSKSLRKKAGFHENDIVALEQYQRSKGPPPNVYYFNSFDHDYPHSKNGIKLKNNLEHDFQYLPFLLANKDDLLVVKNHPSKEWVDHLSQSDLILPDLCIAKSETKKKEELNYNLVKEIIPWAPTKDIERQFEEWSPKFQKNYKGSNDYYDSKKFSHELLKLWYSSISDIEYGEAEESLGFWVKDLAELNDALQKINSWGYGEAFIKTPFGCAGQSLKKVSLSEGSNSLPMTWIQTKLKDQFELWIQPKFEKVMDLSIQVKVENGVVSIIGVSEPITSSNGRHYGHLLNSNWFGNDKSVKIFLLGGKDILLKKWKGHLEHILAHSEKKYFKQQKIGVDAFVYKKRNGGLALFPLIELNSRTTLGHISLKLKDKISTKSVGVFFICPVIKGHEVNLNWLSREIEVTNNKWSRGFMFLTDPLSAKGFVPVCAVGHDFDECVRFIKEYCREGETHSERFLTPVLERLEMYPIGDSP